MARSAQRKLRRGVGRAANAHVHDRPLTKRRAVLRPADEDAVDVGADAIAGNVAGHAGHQQGVVVGVLVADRGHHGQGDRLLIESASGRGTAYPAAAPQSGVAGDRLGAFGAGSGETVALFPPPCGPGVPRHHRRGAHGPVHGGASSRPRRRGTPVRPVQALLPRPGCLAARTACGCDSTAPPRLRARWPSWLGGSVRRRPRRGRPGDRGQRRSCRAVPRRPSSAGRRCPCTGRTPSL